MENPNKIMVGAAGFELATSSSQSREWPSLFNGMGVKHVEKSPHALNGVEIGCKTRRRRPDPASVDSRPYSAARTGPDHCTASGAKALAEKIRLYWLNGHGRTVVMKIASSSPDGGDTHARHDLRSDMINGWPRGMAPKPEQAS